MKTFYFILTALLLGTVASAQRFEFKSRGGTTSNGIRWEILVPGGSPSLNQYFPIPEKSTGKEMTPGTITKKGVIYPLTFGNMPCIIPDPVQLAQIPNAMPGRVVPPAAPIPNPVPDNGGGVQALPSK